MLERVIHPSGLVFYRSPLLIGVGVPHAFTTRLGGVSPPPFDSLNFQPASRSVAHLGPGPVMVIRGEEQATAMVPAPTGNTASAPPLHSSAPPVDQYETVVENFRRVAGALGCSNRRTICVWQVHGKGVCLWPEQANDVTPGDPTSVVAQADALATADAGVLIAVRVADCVPVLMAARDGSAVAAVHAGWRGTVAGIIDAALATLNDRFNCPPRDVTAAIGPCIGAEHFEVGPEVAQAFTAAGLDDAVRHERRPRPHIDLQYALALQLQRAGVSPERIDGHDRCTFRDGAEFYSHRRDEGRTGRMAAVIGAR